MTATPITGVEKLEKLLGSPLSSFQEFVSFADRAVPGAGSPTRKQSELKIPLVLQNYRHMVRHRSGDRTLISKHGSIRFWIKT